MSCPITKYHGGFKEYDTGHHAQITSRNAWSFDAMTLVDNGVHLPIAATSKG